MVRLGKRASILTGLLWAALKIDGAVAGAMMVQKLS